MLLQLLDGLVKLGSILLRALFRAELSAVPATVADSRLPAVQAWVIGYIRHTLSSIRRGPRRSSELCSPSIWLLRSCSLPLAPIPWPSALDGACGLRCRSASRQFHPQLKVPVSINQVSIVCYKYPRYSFCVVGSVLVWAALTLASCPAMYRHGHDQALEYERIHAIAAGMVDQWQSRAV